MKLNNLYNFKNPVKHFLDIDSIELPIDTASSVAGSLARVPGTLPR